MEKFLTKKSVFFCWQTLCLLVTYFAIRVLSYYLTDHIIIQGILVFCILMLLGILYFKNPEWAWYLVIGEIFLGGSGHYLEFIGLSIRTLLIGFFLFLWIAQHLGQRRLFKHIKINKQTTYVLTALFFFLIVALVNGLYHQHEFIRVVQDTMPFAFLLLIFPCYHLFKQKHTQEYLARLIVVFVIGTALFSLFTFIIFSAGLTEIHGDFYSWYRDINLGKITDMTHGFFRVVEPGHLLVVPIILLITSLLSRDEKHHYMWRLIQLLAIIILVLNLSRGYFLALIVGLLVIKYKHHWLKWLKEVAAVILLVIVMFSGIHLAASAGTSPGWNLFGLRLQSFTNPSIEVSTNTRLMILPEIMNVIKQSPILGVGMGAEVSFVNTATYETVTTAHFDWGYLEMWAEMGLLGALTLIILYAFVGYMLVYKIQNVHNWHDFDVGLLAGIISFLVMNITIPALFHVFGILFLIFAITITLKQTSIVEETTTLLYRVFNSLKS